MELYAVMPEPVAVRSSDVHGTPGLSPLFHSRSRTRADPVRHGRMGHTHRSITDTNGAVLFEQSNVTVPAAWLQTATNIVASKYFHGQIGSPERESSVGRLIERVVQTVTEWGQQDGYFDSAESAENFRLELTHLLLHQRPRSIRRFGSTPGVDEPRGYGFVYDREL